MTYKSKIYHYRESGYMYAVIHILSKNKRKNVIAILLDKVYIFIAMIDIMQFGEYIQCAFTHH